MKKTITIYGAILIASLTMTSCGGNSIDNDAKKCAELACKAQKIATQGASNALNGGNMSSAIAEEGKLAQEAVKLEAEMKDKYKDPAEHQKFMEAYSKAMANCGK